MTFAAALQRELGTGRPTMLGRDITGHAQAQTQLGYHPTTKLLQSVSQDFGNQHLGTISYTSEVSPRRYNGRISAFGRSWSNLQYDGHGQLQSYALGGVGGGGINYNHDPRGNRVGGGNPNLASYNGLDQLTSRTLGPVPADLWRDGRGHAGFARNGVFSHHGDSGVAQWQ
jgi:hypothetical protein